MLENVPSKMKRKFLKLFVQFLQARGDANERHAYLYRMQRLRKSFNIAYERFMVWFQQAVRLYEQQQFNYVKKQRELALERLVLVTLTSGTVH